MYDYFSGCEQHTNYNECTHTHPVTCIHSLRFSLIYLVREITFITWNRFYLWAEILERITSSLVKKVQQLKNILIINLNYVIFRNQSKNYKQYNLFLHMRVYYIKQNCTTMWKKK